MWYYKKITIIAKRRFISQLQLFKRLLVYRRLSKFFVKSVIFVKLKSHIPYNNSIKIYYLNFRKIEIQWP